MNSISKRKVLVVSRVFLPKEGGIEDYAYNRCLQDPSEVIVLTSQVSNSSTFDGRQSFPIYRWPSPLFLEKSKAGKLVKQVWYMCFEFFMALKLYAVHRYDYIEWFHGYDFISLLLLSYLIPAKYFIYLHGDDLLRALRNPALRKLFSITIRRSEGVVCNSNFTKNCLEKKLSPNVELFVINPCLRNDKFGAGAEAWKANSKIRQTFTIPESAVLILSVGRLIRRKGFDRVIQSIPGLLENGVDVRYVICGRGEMMAELKALSDQLDVVDRVHFAGYVPEAELAYYYAACDIFAMPTVHLEEISSIEGFGIVYLEAGYFSKPVIASRVGGVSDAVKHFVTGLLVEPNSITDFQQSLLKLCEDKALRDKLGAGGKENAAVVIPHRLIYSNQAN